MDDTMDGAMDDTMDGTTQGTTPGTKDGTTQEQHRDRHLCAAERLDGTEDEAQRRPLANQQLLAAGDEADAHAADRLRRERNNVQNKHKWGKGETIATRPPAADNKKK